MASCASNEAACARAPTARTPPRPGRPGRCPSTRRVYSQTNGTAAASSSACATISAPARRDTSRTAPAGRRRARSGRPVEGVQPPVVPRPHDGHVRRPEGGVVAYRLIHDDQVEGGGPVGGQLDEADRRVGGGRDQADESDARAMSAEHGRSAGGGGARHPRWRRRRVPLHAQPHYRFHSKRRLAAPSCLPAGGVAAGLSSGAGARDLGLEALDLRGEGADVGHVTLHAVEAGRRGR